MKKETKQQQQQQQQQQKKPDKNQEKNKQIKIGNNNTYQEKLSGKWIGRRS